MRNFTMIHNRDEVTPLILAQKVFKGIKWREVTDAIGLSKEWTTAACLRQMTLNKKQADIVMKMFHCLMMPLLGHKSYLIKVLY
jgi:cyanate lyase